MINGTDISARLIVVPLVTTSSFGCVSLAERITQATWVPSRIGAEPQFKMIFDRMTSFAWYCARVTFPARKRLLINKLTGLLQVLELHDVK